MSCFWTVFDVRVTVEAGERFVLLSFLSVFVFRCESYCDMVAFACDSAFVGFVHNIVREVPTHATCYQSASFGRPPRLLPEGANP